MRIPRSGTFRGSLMAAAVLTTLFWLGSPAAHAQDSTYEHLDELAVQMQRHARDVREEVHHHLRGNRYFWQMDRVAHSIEDLASHLHETAHNHGSLQHIRHDVNQLDRWVHYADDLTNHLRWRVRSHDEMEGLQATRRSIHSMLSILHHMQDDLRRLDPHFHHHRSYESGYRGRDGHDRHDHNHNDSYNVRRTIRIYPGFYR